MRQRLHAPTAVVVAMLTAAAVNVAQHWPIERAVSDWYEAFRVKPGHEMRPLVEGHFSSTQERYTLYVQLGEVAPGATVVVPPGSELIIEHFLGLAGAAAVEHGAAASIGPEVADRLQAAVVATGEDRHVGPYAIAVPGDDAVATIVVVDGPQQTWFVEAGLLDAAGEGS